MVAVTTKSDIDTVRDEREIWAEFIETREYDFSQAEGMCSDPRQIAVDWLCENYHCKDEADRFRLESYFFSRM